MATILVDMDDTIINFRERWINELNRLSGSKLESESATNWNITQYYPTLAISQIFELLEGSDFWKEVTPKPGAAEYIERLQSEGHKVLICTASHYKTLSSKMQECLFKHFPTLEWSDVIVTQYKHLISGDYIVDDNLDNIRRHPGTRLLMSAPHNRTEIQDFDVRVDSWEQIYDTISVCEQVKSILSHDKNR